MAHQTPKGAFSDRAVPGAEFIVRVMANAGRAAVDPTEDGFRIAVTEAPENGRANTAVARLLARALGIAPGRLRLIRGTTSRNKRFRLD